MNLRKDHYRIGIFWPFFVHRFSSRVEVSRRAGYFASRGKISASSLGRVCQGTFAKRGSGNQSWGPDIASSFTPTPFFFTTFFHVLLLSVRELFTTSNGGPLGSCIDEERSKLRYLVWIAEFSESSSLWTQMVLLVFREHVCLSVCFCVYPMWGTFWGRCWRRESWHPFKCCIHERWYAVHVNRCCGPSWCGCSFWARCLTLWTSDQARSPAEFKHINKRRKRN